MVLIGRGRTQCFALMFSSLLGATASSEAETGDNNQCGLYLAVSSTSTSEKSSWGIYAGQEIPANSPIGYPEIGINLPHLKANTFFSEYNGDEAQEEYLGRIVDFFEEVIWVPSPAGAKFELEKGRAVTAIPGGGALAGFNAKFTNADWNGTSAYVRPVWGNDALVPHPNRGAVSPFYHIVIQSRNRIDAGSEIFMDYGDNWAEDEGEDALTAEDFQKLDETVDKMLLFFEKHKESMDAAAATQVYNFLVKEVMNAAVGAGKARRIAKILPPRPDDLYKVKQVGGALKFSEPTVYRDVEWLKQYGRCMDNIRPGPSTIPYAGRGAFATRKIAAGGLVAPVPLVHVPDSTILDMHELTVAEDGDYMRESHKVVHRQLFLNYVYGHPQSTMVFYPTGAGVAFINHHDEPNAKMVWSDHPSNEKLWFQMSPKDLMEEEHLRMGLLIEIVATRDIEEGEEIFIDYGDEWKAAWREHVERWETRKQAGELPEKWPLRAVDMIDQYRTIPYKTEQELASDPYPETVDLKAFLAVQDTEKKGTRDDPSIWGGESEDDNIYRAENLRTCTIVERHRTEGSSKLMPYTYMIRWISSRGKEVYVDRVPHEAFVFVDAPGTSDQFLEGTFRHYIGIPDEIFPQGPWRNRVE